MALRASELRSLGIGIGVLETTLKDQLRTIDAVIQGADKRLGWNVVTYKLPVDFRIPGFDDPMEQQRFIYSGIITSLLQRDFHVRIWLDMREPKLFIGYDIKFSSEQLKAMNDTLSQANMTSEEDIKTFKEGGFKRAEAE